MKHLRRHTLLAALAVACLLPFVPASATAQSAVIETPVFAAGGGTTGGGGTEVSATIGQPFSPEETLSGVDNETVWVGFWAVIPSDPTSVREERVAGAAGTTGITSSGPNPFREHLAVEIGLATSGRVVLSIHDPLGREIARLIDGTRTVGAHRVTWRPQGLPAGTYLVRLEVDGVVRGTSPIQHYR
jgi:hypothetical protein